ncbi:hypothetical protein HDV01_000803 [Terramyces sp. JEL0728]|nr:hypothetical protein HDV01_000803 [Terramyces sp. JEL0728]
MKLLFGVFGLVAAQYTLQQSSDIISEIASDILPYNAICQSQADIELLFSTTEITIQKYNVARRVGFNASGENGSLVTVVSIADDLTSIYAVTSTCITATITNIFFYGSTNIVNEIIGYQKYVDTLQQIQLDIDFNLFNVSDTAGNQNANILVFNGNYACFNMAWYSFHFLQHVQNSISVYNSTLLDRIVDQSINSMPTSFDQYLTLDRLPNVIKLQSALRAFNLSLTIAAFDLEYATYLTQIGSYPHDILQTSSNMIRGATTAIQVYSALLAQYFQMAYMANLHLLINQDIHFCDHPEVSYVFFEELSFWVSPPAVLANDTSLTNNTLVSFSQLLNITNYIYTLQNASWYADYYAQFVSNCSTGSNSNYPDQFIPICTGVIQDQSSSYCASPSCPTSSAAATTTASTNSYGCSPLPNANSSLCICKDPADQLYVNISVVMSEISYDFSTPPFYIPLSYINATDVCEPLNLTNSYLIEYNYTYVFNGTDDGNSTCDYCDNSDCSGCGYDTSPQNDFMGYNSTAAAGNALSTGYTIALSTSVSTTISGADGLPPLINRMLIVLALLSFGYDLNQIAVLAVTGFAGSAIFGTYFGSLSDK